MLYVCGSGATDADVGDRFTPVLSGWANCRERASIRCCATSWAMIAGPQRGCRKGLAQKQG